MMNPRKTLHLIGQAHLDPVWLWRWRDGCAEALTTMQSAVDRMAETPAFRFTRSSAITYRWVQEMDPRLFAEIRRRVREGRWEVVNGWIEQPDCNIPSTESLVRQSLYGKTYFAETLGVDVAVGYNVDSFGHSGGLPQLLARAGFRYYVIMRPNAGEYGADLPILFWWESPDGSRVLCWRIPGAYTQGPHCSPDQFETTLREGAATHFPPGFADGAFFYGVGNHGGGPTRAHIDRILALQRDPSLPELRFSALAVFFAALERSPAMAAVPVVRGELQHHARGCYAAMGEIKALNRRAERALAQAETLAVMEGFTGPRLRPAAALREAWWSVLFNQFHDVLAGSAIESAYRDARDDLGGVCHAGDRAAVAASHALARRVNTSDAPAGVLTCVNPLPWTRTALVQFDASTYPQPTPITHLASKDGQTIPIQWLEPEANVGPWDQKWGKLTALVPLPACGYRAYYLASGNAPAAEPAPPAIHVHEQVLGVAGVPTSDGADLLAAPLSLVVIDDPHDTWGHDVEAYRDESGRPALVSCRVVADGPVCRVVRQRASWRSSEIRLDIITYGASGLMELRVRVNWQERRQILKLEIPTALTGVRVFARAPGGVAERLPDGAEEPCQDWVALEGHLRGQPYSVGLINAGTYSYDCLKGLLRTVVVRSAPFAEHLPYKLPPDTDAAFLDQGWQERRFWLIHGSGNLLHLNLQRLAEEVQTPAQYMVDSAHPGAEPWEASFLEVAPDSVTVTAVKPAEDGDGLIVRLEEMGGRPAAARLRIPPLGVDQTVPMGPWELRTLRVRPAKGRGAEVMETDLLERPL